MGFLLLTILLSLFTVSCELQIQRKTNGLIQNAYYFYHGSDYFTNPRREEEFCKNRNAVCKNAGHKCSQCYCRKGKTFISYRDGCLSYVTASNRLKGTILFLLDCTTSGYLNYWTLLLQ